MRAMCGLQVMIGRVMEFMQMFVLNEAMHELTMASSTLLWVYCEEVG